MPTPTPGPTDKITVIGVTYEEEGTGTVRNVDGAGTRGWGILKEYRVKVEIRTLADAFDPGDYDIQLNLHSQDTGIYHSQPGVLSVCHPEKPGTETDWKRIRPNRTGLEWRVSFDLIRCSIGVENNKGLTMLVKHKDDRVGPVFSKNITNKIPRAPHREGIYSLGYHLNYTSVEGVAPTTYSVDTPDEAQARKAVSIAADDWETAVDDAISIKPSQDIASGDFDIVRISPYWWGSPGICNPEKSYACITVNVDADSHINGSHRIRVSYPPSKPVDDDAPRWTNKLDLALDDSSRGLYYYFPNGMAHELGHAFGLSHTRDSKHTMGPYNFTYVQITPNDQHGMEQAVASHDD